jgi:peptidoglycan/LPS O-acetylase OafA/YrhL
VFTVNKNPTVDDLRKFGYAMFAGFAFIGALIYVSPWFKTRDMSVLAWPGTWAQWTALCLGLFGVALCGLCLVSPTGAKPVYLAWMTVAVGVGTIVSTILLTVLFVFLLPVFSIIVRIGDPLRKKRKPRGSYWEHYKPHEPTIERMRRPF